MKHSIERSGVAQSLAYFLATLLVAAFGVSQFASVCSCQKAPSSNARRQDCTPPEWNDPKWEGKPEGKQVQVSGTPQSPEATARSELVAPYWKSINSSEARLDPSGAAGAPARAATDGTSDEERLGEIQSAVEAPNGQPAQPTYLQLTSTVALNIFFRSGRVGRATGFVWANGIVATSAHGFMAESEEVTSIQIVPPEADANTPPTPVDALAYQMEPAFNIDDPESPDDLALIYYNTPMAARVVPMAPVADYQSVQVLGCQNAHTCPAMNVMLVGTGGTVFVNGNPTPEWYRPAIRIGLTVAYFQAAEGNAQYLYIYPPLSEGGDSGGPAYVQGQIVGMIQGIAPIPVNYLGQVGNHHEGTIIQLLSATRVTATQDAFRINMQAVRDFHNYFGFPIPVTLPYRSADRRFGVFYPYGQANPPNRYYTLDLLNVALAAMHFLIQFQPPRNGCNHP